MKLDAKKVLEWTGLTEEDFDKSLEQYFELKQKKPEGKTGLQVFIEDFMKEGWCKKEKPELSENELEEAVQDYVVYWF